MAILNIKRDWGVDPCIVRILSNDTLAQVGTAGYLTAQQANIIAINEGVFGWVISDFVLVYASDGWGQFTISTDFSSLNTFGAAGSGTVTQVNTGTGLTGGPITSSGTVSFASIAAMSLWANTTGAIAVPTVTPLSTFLLAANNLMDLPSKPTARTNLGLGTMAIQNATAVAITGGTAILGGLSAPCTYVAVGTSTNLTANSGFSYYEFTTGGGILNDPTGISAYINGMTFELKNNTGSNCSFTPFTGQTIDGASSLTIPTGTGYIIAKGSTQWVIIATNGASGGSSPWTSNGAPGSAFGGNASLGTATTSNSLAWGDAAKAGNNTTSADSAFAFGTSAVALDNGSIALGQFSASNGVNAIAIGTQTVASATLGTAIGYQASAGENSIAIGSQSSAAGATLGGGTAIGNGNAALGMGSVAMGNGSIATNNGSFVIQDSNGVGKTDSAANQFVANYAGGYYLYNGNNLAATIDASGLFNVYNNIALNNGSFAISLLAPALTADVSFILPLADGTSGQFLQTNGAGTLTFASASSGSGLTPRVITTSSTLTTNSRNVVRPPGSSFLNLALPATSAVGDVIVLINDTTSGPAGFTVTQASGQIIYYGAINSTTGVSGNLTLNETNLFAEHSVVTMSCTVANTTWTVESSIGSFGTN